MHDGIGIFVGVVHVCLYAFMAVALFSRDALIVWTHMILSAAMLVHWATNDDRCILTEIECRLRRVSAEQSLTRRLLAPILSVDTAVAPVTVLALILSSARLFMSWSRAGA